MPGRHVGLQSFRVVDRGQARHRGPGRLLEVLFENYSKFYDFYLGSYRIPGGTPASDNQVQEYDCVSTAFSTGTQAMPPGWTDVTDPNVAFDTKGRVYQTTLPFNAFWGGSTLHPDGAIDVS